MFLQLNSMKASVRCARVFARYLRASAAAHAITTTSELVQAVRRHHTTSKHPFDVLGYSLLTHASEAVQGACIVLLQSGFN